MHSCVLRMRMHMCACVHPVFRQGMALNMHACTGEGMSDFAGVPARCRASFQHLKWCAVLLRVVM